MVAFSKSCHAPKGADMPTIIRAYAEMAALKQSPLYER